MWLCGTESTCKAGDPSSTSGSEDLLEEEMATHSNILAWEIPRTEEPGGLQSMRSQRVGHDWVTKQQQYIHLRSEEGVRETQHRDGADWGVYTPWGVFWELRGMRMGGCLCTGKWGQGGLTVGKVSAQLKVLTRSHWGRWKLPVLRLLALEER